MPLLRHRLILVSTFLAGVIAAPGAQAPAVAPQPATAAELFDTSKVWTVRLAFTPDAWAALTPASPPLPTPASGPPVQGFIGPDGKRNGISALRGLDFEYVRALLTFEGRQMQDVAVRHKGNGTYGPGQTHGKPSFKIDLNKHVKGQKIAGVSTLNLHNSIVDASLMNEALAYRFFRDAGTPAPRTAYARVYVTVPGVHADSYLGLYTLVENVDNNFAAEYYRVQGGAIFKPVTTELFKHVGTDWAAYNQMYDPKTDLTAADQQRIIDFANLVTRASDAEFAARFADFIDMDAFVKHMAALVWMANPDSILQQGQNYYLYLHPATRKLAFIPWDQDHSFGHFLPFATPERQQQLDVMRPWTRPYEGSPYAENAPANRFLERTFALESFTRPYLARLAELNRTVTEPARLIAEFDALARALGPIAALEPSEIRVAGFRQAIGSEPYPRPINNAVIETPTRTFLAARHASVQAQLQKLGVR